MAHQSLVYDIKLKENDTYLFMRFYSGDEKKAKAFLKEQKTMLEEIAEEEAEETEGDGNG